MTITQILCRVIGNNTTNGLDAVEMEQCIKKLLSVLTEREKGELMLRIEE